MPGEFRKRELVDNTFIVTFIVDDKNKGVRADQYLRLQFKFKSRSQLQRDIEAGNIRICGKRLKPATILAPGDEIKVFTRYTDDEPAVDINYKILYEDEDLIAVDKPGNLPVHPAGRFLFNTLLTTLRKKGGNFFLIHRLDRETSGVLLLAKQKTIAATLVKQFRERKVEKRYFAIVHGHCHEKQFSVDADIGPAKSSAVRLKMMAYPKGSSLLEPNAGIMDALTHFKVISQGASTSLLDCDLKTGRQHQIRVHLEHTGHPVVGDKLYGNNEAFFLEYIKERELNASLTKACGGATRQALHSRYLRFFHESKRQWVELESPLPEDMRQLLLTL